MLAPLAWLWCWLARRRVLAYRAGRRAVRRLPVPVIVIGNVTVGGTGKTPLTLWLARRLLERGYKPAILSRGHGAKIEGEARRVMLDSLAHEVGDEPLMLKRALPEVEVFVHPERFRAGQAALAWGADVVVLDDGLQHLQLARDVEIALVDAARGQNMGMGNGRCLPAGPLREPVKRLSDIPLEISERLDLPAESVAGVPKLTVTGRRRALVENHCGLLEYSHECIVVDGGRVRVCIRGTNLQLVAMDSTALLISGTIACAEFA